MATIFLTSIEVLIKTQASPYDSKILCQKKTRYLSGNFSVDEQCFRTKIFIFKLSFSFDLGHECQLPHLCYLIIVDEYSFKISQTSLSKHLIFKILVVVTFGYKQVFEFFLTWFFMIASALCVSLILFYFSFHPVHVF